MASFNIPITNQNLLEGVEDFMLSIIPSALPSNVTVGNLRKATVFIGDFHCKHIVVVVVHVVVASSDIALHHTFIFTML